MCVNSSRPSDSTDSLCLYTLPNVSDRQTNATFYQVNLASCVASALLAPMAVIGNALILAAIWRNPSLRTPSYVLLAGLAVTDFCTGLLSLPLFVFYKIAAISESMKTYCAVALVMESVGLFFSSLTLEGITLIAVERWLHMSRRSLLTVRRVIIVYIACVLLLIPLVACQMYNRFYPNLALNILVFIYYLFGVICVSITAFAHFRIFQIIRQHQNQVQTNEISVNMEKYKKSMLTVFYILAVFVLSYVPFICCNLVFRFVQLNEMSYRMALGVSAVVVFSSSFVNPLLYYWRIKEIRDTVRPLICKQNGEVT